MIQIQSPAADKRARPLRELRASVLISTYNWPAALEKVLRSFFAQNRRDFELVIADDGSRPETAALIARLAQESPVPIQHIWQPDAGFGKCRILNKALAVARGPRIIVTDGDCVVRADFVDTHIRRARPGHFLSGSYFKQPQAVSEAITAAEIADQSVFTARWLAAHGVKWGRLIKVMGRGWRGRLLDRIGGGRPTWNGHSASCLRAEALLVNGFDEEMGYGGEDVEFGWRLNQSGLSADKIRYSTVALHLHHERGYVTPEMLEANRLIKERSRAERRRWAERGVDQWLDDDGQARLGPEDQLRLYPAV